VQRKWLIAMTFLLMILTAPLPMTTLGHRDQTRGKYRALVEAGFWFASSEKLIPQVVEDLAVGTPIARVTFSILGRNFE
jgi:hypothetical protein